jgi:hypothetical protein
MTTLTIKYRAITEAPDHQAMAAVRRGAKTLNEVTGDTVAMLHQIGSGQCEFSGTGNSYVCY